MKQHLKKLTLTLVALFAISTGTWADETVFEYADPMVGTLTQGTTGTSATTVTINSKSVNAIKFGNTYNYADGKYITIAPSSGSFKKGDVVSIAGCINIGNAESYAKAGIYTADGDGATQLYETANVVNAQLSTDAPVVETYTLTQDAEKLLIARSTGTTALYITTLKVVRTASDPAGIDLTPDATRKIWTLAAMPAGDVELQVEYCPEAELVDGTDVAPAAADGTIIVGTESPLVTAPDAVSQGTLMYLVTTTNEQPTSTQGFSADVPTAADVTAPGTQFVWYYIKGDADHNDSPIFRTPIEVNVLKDEFDITFNALNTNTIEDGKATVKVDGTATTLDADHQVKGVKIGKPVTVEAKTGYKFRKVEVKKGSAAAKTITIGDMELTYADGDNWETIVSKNSDKIKIFSNKIVQLAQPAPNQYRYIHVWYTEVKPSDPIDPSKNYQWDIVEVAW
jgi:hypothetical protein